MLRIVIADSDARLRGIVRTVLESDGHKVKELTNRVELARAVRTGVDLVILDVTGEATSALVSGRAFGRMSRGDAPYVLLTSGDRDESFEAIQSAKAFIGARRVFAKPYSVLDLQTEVLAVAAMHAEGLSNGGLTGAGSVQGDTVDFDAISASISSSRRRRRTSRPRLRRRATRKLGTLWSQRRSGIATVQLRDDEAAVMVPLSHGAPIQPEHAELLLEAMFTRKLAFRRVSVAGRGDWTGFGAQLFDHVQQHIGSGFLDRHRYEAASPTPLAASISSLPLSQHARALVDDGDGTTPLGKVLAIPGIDPQRVSREVAALAALGFVTVHPPMHHRPEPARNPVQPSSSSAEVAPPPPEPSQTTSVRARPAAKGGRGTDPGSDVMGPSATDLVSGTTRGGLMRRARTSFHHRTRTPSWMRDLEPVEARASLAKFLERARQGLAPRIVRRMWLDLNAGRPSSVRVSREVRRAPISSRTTRAQARMLQRARELVAGKRYSEAARILERARAIDPDNPDVVAALAMAHLYDEQRDARTRLDEVKVLLTDSERRSPNHFETVYLLAQVLSRTGDTEEARRRATQACRLDPTHQGARNLLSKLTSRRTSRSVS